MRLPRLFLSIFTLSLQRALAYRADLLFQGVVSGFGLISGLLALAVVFSHVHRLVGWPEGQAVVLLGTFSTVSGLLEACVEPNLEFFGGKINGGELDDVLLQPAPSILLASLGTCRPWALSDVFLGLAVTGAGVHALGGAVTPGGMIAFLTLLPLGVLIAWSYRVALASAAFWAPGFESAMVYLAFWQMGRYPVSIYAPALRLILTYLVPVAFVSAAPAYALTHGFDPGLLARSGLLTLASLLAANLTWRRGLRRYTSATS